MDPQEIFDTVARHLLTQKQRAVTTTQKGDVCAYRGADGTKCALGCLIPDSLYSPDMEGDSAYYVLKTYPAIAAHIGLGNMLLVMHLQPIHDAGDPRRWKQEMLICSTMFNLQADVLAEFPDAKEKP